MVRPYPMGIIGPYHTPDESRNRLVVRLAQSSANTNQQSRGR